MTLTLGGQEGAEETLLLVSLYFFGKKLERLNPQPPRFRPAPPSLFVL